MRCVTIRTMDMYREKLLDHYHNPRNYGKIEDADAIMTLENLNCGDKISVSLKIDKGKVQEAKFEGEGCAIAVAAASMLTEEIIGKTKAEIAKINLERLMEIMGVNLTPYRYKCAALSLESVKQALSIPFDQIS